MKINWGPYRFISNRTLSMRLDIETECADYANIRMEICFVFITSMKRSLLCHRNRYCCCIVMSSFPIFFHIICLREFIYIRAFDVQIDASHCFQVNSQWIFMNANDVSNEIGHRIRKCTVKKIEINFRVNKLNWILILAHLNNALVSSKWLIWSTR